MIPTNYPENRESIFSYSFGKTIEQAVPIYCRFLLVWSILLLVLSCSSSAVAQIGRTSDNSDWIGSYYFSETAPAAKRRGSQDVVPSASYEITIEEKEQNLTASFAANGVQLFEAYECRIVTKDTILEFYFQSLASAEVQNFRRFKKGDLLFRLFKSGDGKNTKYLFQPAAYKIVRVDSSKQKTPIYFEKPQVRIFQAKIRQIT